LLIDVEEKLEQRKERQEIETSIGIRKYSKKYRGKRININKNCKEEYGREICGNGKDSK
jgi:hypothetical protein